jgi:limonene-1,2-epoxide hydrolase
LRWQPPVDYPIAAGGGRRDHAPMTHDGLDPARQDRRRFILASIAGSALGLFSPAEGDAAQAGGDTQATVHLVNDFCAAVSKRDAAVMRPFLADDIVYRITETTPPVVGLQAVMDTYKKFVSDATSVEFQVLETFASGPIVINHRIDRFVSPRPLTWEGVGVFFVKDDKIKEWSDYTIRTQRG